MSTRPRLLILLPHLGGGGAERVLALLARSLDPDRYEVHLATLLPPRAGAVELPPAVRLHPLGTASVRWSAVAIVRLVRSLRPDLVLSTMFHLNLFLLLLRGLFPARTRILVRQNDSIATTLAAAQSRRIPAWVLRLLYRFLYPRADLVVCQNAKMVEDVAAAAPGAQARLCVLPNLLDARTIRSAAPAAPSPWIGTGPHLLALGRMAPAKGFDLLLEAFARLRPAWPAARLLIAGEGPDRASLEEQVRRLGLENVVQLSRALENPWGLFAGASAFVLSSRTDPFPNALLEAAAAGLPIIATPGSPGLSALLRDQPGVWLAAEASVEALTDALVAALGAIQPGRRFAHAFVEPYTLEHALPLWQKKLAALLDRGRA